jgi:hypothetical protein
MQAPFAFRLCPTMTPPPIAREPQPAPDDVSACAVKKRSTVGFIEGASPNRANSEKIGTITTISHCRVLKLRREMSMKLKTITLASILLLSGSLAYAQSGGSGAGSSAGGSSTSGGQAASSTTTGNSMNGSTTGNNGPSEGPSSANGNASSGPPSNANPSGAMSGPNTGSGNSGSGSGMGR